MVSTRRQARLDKCFLFKNDGLKFGVVRKNSRKQELRTKRDRLKCLKNCHGTKMPHSRYRENTRCEDRNRPELVGEALMTWTPDLHTPSHLSTSLRLLCI